MKLSFASLTLPLAALATLAVPAGAAPRIESAPIAELAADEPASLATETNVTLLPARLESSQKLGIAALRLTRDGGDLHFEQLDAKGKVLGGFVFHPVVDEMQQLTSMQITRLGAKSAVFDGRTPSKQAKLGAADRAALAAMVDELSDFSDDSDADPQVMYSIRGWLSAIGAGIACGLAAVEGGLNPLADADCAIATGLWLDEEDDEDED